MRIALLCAYPTYPYRQKVKFLYVRRSATPMWNYNLARGLARIPGNQVHVLTNAPLLVTRRLEDNGVQVHFVAHLPKVNFWEYITGLRYSKINLHRLLRDLNPDIVHGSGTDHEYGFAAATAPYPSVVTIHGVMQEVVKKMGYPRWSFMSLLAKYERRTLDRVKYLIAICKYVIDAFPDYKGTVFHIPNAVGESFFEDYPTSREIDIVYVGKIIPLKRVLNLVEAVHMLVDKYPRILAHIVGTGAGAYHAKVVRYIRRYHLESHIVLRGQLCQEEVAATMAKGRVLVLPSIAETAPMVCAEAQALGTPVVATTAGALPEMIDHGKTGFLVKPDDVVELTEAIDSVLSDRNRRRAMGAAARERARALYHPDFVARKTTEAYYHILANP